MMKRHGWWAAVVLCVVAVIAAQPAAAAAPAPVYAPVKAVADPGMLRSDNNFYAFVTGENAPVHRGDTSEGSWSSRGAALSGRPTWAADEGAVWAPDAWRTQAGFVLYYSIPAKDFDGQRCIGVAVAGQVDGTYTPVGDSPLICPGGRHGAEDSVPGRPVGGAGVIDPSPFQDSEGRNFLLYKTQQTPSSLRMVRLTDGGTHTAGRDSGELVQNDGIIENPVMRQRGSKFVLFASRYNYANCTYASVWMRSTNKWDFSGSNEHPLLNSGASGVCGPGGADVTHSLSGEGWRIFLHGWLCGDRPCQESDFERNVERRRVLYAAILRWGSDRATPSVGKFL